MNAVDFSLGFILLFLGNLIGLWLVEIEDPFRISFICSSTVVCLWILTSTVMNRWFKLKMDRKD